MYVEFSMSQVQVKTSSVCRDNCHGDIVALRKSNWVKNFQQDNKTTDYDVRVWHAYVQ